MEATDAGGAVVAQRRYYPYGGVRWASGTFPTDFGFAGQRSVPGTGLVFMHARYYHPGLGRFISADTVVPNPGNPQDLNRYAYVRNNPLRYTDPDGHFPWLPLVIVGGVLIGGAIGVAITPEWQFWDVSPVTGPRVSPPTSEDMTVWLVDQMQTNAQSPATRLMRENWQSLSPANRVGALRAWTALVRTRAVWDFKEDIRREMPDLQDVTLGDQLLNYQAVANIHYGFVGRAAGFQSEILKAGAGIAQWMDWHRKNPENVGPWQTYFDQPFDAWSIGLGIFLYDQYGYRLDELTPEAFAQALEEYIEKYGAPPPASP